MALSFQDVDDTKKMQYPSLLYHARRFREILLTIQGKDLGEAAPPEESGDEEAVLPPPALDNLNIIAEEFSAPALCVPSKRTRITQQFLKDDVLLHLKCNLWCRGSMWESSLTRSMRPSAWASATGSSCCSTYSRE